MAKFKLLIIDDDPNRETELHQIFQDERFDVNFIFERQIFWESISSLPKYDCIISDISLDKWRDTGNAQNIFFNVIERIGKKMPIILYSAVITEVLEWTSKLREDGYNLIYTVALNKQNNGNINSVEQSQVIRNNIDHFLLSYYKYANLSFGKDDEINILHISDLQFGDSKFDQNLCNSFDSSLLKVIKDGIVPKIDFVAITGDIAYDGTPNQYKDADIWISKLCKSIFGNDNFQDRLLLVPGNHDANLSLCSLNKYKYHFPNKEETKGEIKFEERETEIDDYTMYSVDPFRYFAFSLTKDENWLNKESMSFINSKFSYLGFNFVHLNVLSPFKQLGYKEAKFELDNKEINILKENYTQLRFSSHIQSIILTHPSPKHLGYDCDEAYNGNWITISNFLKSINTMVYVFGHRHKNLNNHSIPIDNETKIKLCGTATLLCEPDSGDVRGFKILKIKRKDNVISDSEISTYDFRPDGKIIKIN